MRRINILALNVLIVIILFTINILLVWPGKMTPDSNAQYQQAIINIYSDHHPPIMSYLWHFLNKIYPGPGVMLFTQLFFLYSALGFMSTIQLQENNKFTWMTSFIYLFPFLPPIIVYSNIVVKDLHYAFSFLLLSSILSFYTIRKKIPNEIMTILIYLLMVYGAAVKYQGQFCVIILAIWLSFILFKKNRFLYKFLFGILIYSSIVISIILINNNLVSAKNTSNSWQYVKLYDLAAISIATQQDLIPLDNKTVNYTFQKLNERFMYPTVDPYIYSEDNIFKVTSNTNNSNELKRMWWKNILSNPLAYIRHRTINIMYALLSRPGYAETVNFLSKFENFKAGSKLHKTVGAIFFMSMSHFIYISMGLGFWLFSIFCFKTSNYARILFATTSISLLMLLILFFKSMAGVPRYTFISVVLNLSSCLYFYMCYIDYRASSFFGRRVSYNLTNFDSIKDGSQLFTAKR